MYQVHDEQAMETDVKLEDMTFLSFEGTAVSTSRNRPRGSGVGKSIHKAAEAPVHSRRSAFPSKSQVSQSGQTVTPRISTSNVTIRDLSSSAHSNPQKNIARKTMRSRIHEIEPSIVRRSLATRRAVKSGYYTRASSDGEDFTCSTSSSSSSRSSSSKKSFCHETYMIPDNVIESPPAPLVKAYEELFAQCLFLQHKRKLPFLLRNLKRAFRIRCKQTGEIWPSDHISVSRGEGKETVLVLYQYTDPQGVHYAFQSPHFVYECPLCSLMGILPSWSALARHLSWNHHEIGFQINQGADDTRPKVLIFLDEGTRSVTNLVSGMQALNAEESGNVTSKSSPTRTSSHLSDIDVEIGTSEGKSPMQKMAPSLGSQPSRLFEAFDIPAYHGPAEPVISTGPSKMVSYRPVGPRLYDHFVSLSLDEFGPLSWFVLDKEEETLELTDVLDEDKVMCALWGRWILFNRSTFISDYKTGIEKFLSRHWTMIYKAAGWASWRAFLLTLVYHRFLTSTEMVHLLKLYNELRRDSRTLGEN